MFKYDNLRMNSDLFYDIQKRKLGDIEYHNGYILMNIKKHYPLLIEAFEKHHEITFDKYITTGFGDYRVIGFDTMHAYNITSGNHSFNYVENEIYKIIEEWGVMISE